MGWLDGFMRRRAARTYLRRLPPLMRERWGRATFYTPGQVRTALGVARLDGPHAAIAYAGLLTRADYEGAQVPLPLDYDEARALFYGGLPSRFAKTYGYEGGSDWHAYWLLRSESLGDGGDGGGGGDGGSGD